MDLKRRLAKLLTYDQKNSIRRVVAKHAPKRLDVAPLVLPYKVLIGTHHKAGTHWLESVFRTICGWHSLRYFAGSYAALPEQWDVFLEHHSRFDFTKLPEVFRGLHVIRDPRDIIVSGCFYHQTSDEPWLHIPDKKFQGRSYQQAINRFSSVDDKILFEMENIAKISIDHMSSWTYTNPLFMELRYEDLIVDTDLLLFHRAFSFLEFPANALPSSLMIAYRKSLFSGRVVPSGHVRSGLPGQWRRHFKVRHRERFLELFGDVLVRLRYEQDADWTTTDGAP